MYNHAVNFISETMKRIYLVLSILAFFMCQTSFAQEAEYQIIDSLKNTVLDYVDVEVFPINEFEMESDETSRTKRTVFKVDTVSIGKEINGRYIKMDRYAILSNDYKHFFANELILKDTLYSYLPAIAARRMAKICDQYNYIIKNVKTGKLYYTTGDILSKWGKDYVIVELYSRIDKLNVKRKIIDDKIFVYLNGFQCVLNMDVAQALFDGDPSCIKAMNVSVNKYKDYNKIASDLAVKLSNHIKSYKAHLLKDDGMVEWKKDTKECDTILTKMRNLPYANSEIYNQQLDEVENEVHTATIDLVLYSKGKLGI